MTENVIPYKDTQKGKFEEAARLIIEGCGDNLNREGLQDTPKRFAGMLIEMLEGMKYTNKQIAKMFDKSFEDLESGDLVVIEDIPIFSFCEHHIALMYNMTVTVGYIPNGKVIGLSKVARVADMVSKRLQLQEKIGTDIKEVLELILNTNDIIVVVKGNHSCMTARGIKKTGATKTSALGGAFYTDQALRQEFYSML